MCGLSQGGEIGVPVSIRFEYLSGVGASTWLSGRGQQEAARANLFLAGERVRKNDLVNAMNHAQSARCNAPNAFDPYEAIGDIYTKLGVPSAAREMYKEAIGRLTTDGENSMPFTSGVTSPAGATELIQRKLDALPPAS
jgi:hypothetical protein